MSSTMWRYMRVVVAVSVAVGVTTQSACSKGKKAPESGSTSEATPSPSDAPPQREGKVDEKLTPIIAELVANFEKHEGVTAKFKTELAVAASGPGSTSGEGIYDCKRQDGKLLISLWLTNTMNIFTTDKNLFSVEVIDDMYDGEFLYKRLQQHKLNQLVKRHYSHDGILQIGGRGLFEPMTRKNDLRPLPDETLDGNAMVVIEAAPLSGAGKAKHYFDRQTGIRHKFVESNAAGVPQVTLTLSEIKLNPEFPADRFLPKMPAGFKFVDETLPAGPKP